MVTYKQKNLFVVFGLLIVLVSTVNRFVQSSLISLVVVILTVFFVIGLVLLLAPMAKEKIQQKKASTDLKS